MNNQNKKVLELAKHYDKTLNPNVDAAWSKFESKMKSEGKLVEVNFMQFFASAAAIALVVAAFFLFRGQSSSSFETFKTAENQVEKFILPDGSNVWVNESSVFANTDFAGDVRQVKLEGEAFFEVMPNTEKPFIVESGDLKVKVLGTAFNVRNYKGENIEISVREGKVEVESNFETIILKASEKVVFSGKTQRLKKSSASNAGGWTTGALVFDDQPLMEVITRIERQYGVQIAIRNQSLVNCPFKTNLQNADWSDVKKVIELSFGCKIEEKAKNAFVLKGGSCN